jgi:uncharacterized protein (DUF362 family)
MKEFFNNDVFIDIPITKDHAGNKFTGTMKNMMGLNYPTNNRENFHRPGWKTDINDIKHLDQCIADLNTIFLPALCVVDATEFIITNGTLWGLEAEDLFQIKMAQDHGLGHMDLKKTKIKKVKI